MKLKSKLIPLAGLAAVCATVAPITLTSCGAQTSDFVDLTSRYTPNIEMYSGRDYFVTKYDAWEMYANEVEKNPQIFVNDYLWHCSNDITYVQGIVEESDAAKIIEDLPDPFEPAPYTPKPVPFYPTDKINKAINDYKATKDQVQKKSGIADDYIGLAKYHNVKITDVTAKAVPYIDPVNHINTKVLTLSFSCEYEHHYSFIDNILTKAVDKPINKLLPLATAEHGIIKFENIPYVLNFNTRDQMWEVEPSASFMVGGDGYKLKSNPWSFGFQSTTAESSYLNTPAGDVDYNYEYQTDFLCKWDDKAVKDYATTGMPNWKVETIMEYLHDFWWQSYYFLPVGLGI